MLTLGRVFFSCGRVLVEEVRRGPNRRRLSRAPGRSAAGNGCHFLAHPFAFPQGAGPVSGPPGDPAFSSRPPSGSADSPAPAGASARPPGRACRSRPPQASPFERLSGGLPRASRRRQPLARLQASRADAPTVAPSPQPLEAAPFSAAAQGQAALPPLASGPFAEGQGPRSSPGRRRRSEPRVEPHLLKRALARHRRARSPALPGSEGVRRRSSSRVLSVATRRRSPKRASDVLRQAPAAPRRPAQPRSGLLPSNEGGKRRASGPARFQSTLGGASACA